MRRRTCWIALMVGVVMCVSISLAAVAQGQPAKTLYVGGAFALTGAYAADVEAMLAAFEDYVKYVNETKRVAPWRNEKWPADINLEVLWRDDELKPAKALTIYEELKAKGILVFHCSGSPQALALKDRLKEDGMGATNIATGPYMLTPPGTIFSHYPLYTDSLAGVADWYKEKWKESRKPRVAYLTADNAMGKSMEIPEMEAYLKKAGYEFAGIQYVPLVPTSPPTTQLMWLKQNKVDLALGVMVNPGTQPTVKEMVRLGMGPHLDYKMTFAAATPSHLQVFLPAMGKLGEGFVIGGGYPSWDDPCPGMKFYREVLAKYRPNKPVTNISYITGVLEVMTMVEALRLAVQQTPVDKLKPVDVLNNGWYKIKNLNTGELSSTPMTYGPGKVEGVDAVRVDQVVNGKIAKQGVYPCRHIYKH
jgi:ABC-type branched-subunit amino acid transport system substrate-binding protein